MPRATGLKQGNTETSKKGQIYLIQFANENNNVLLPEIIDRLLRKKGGV
jgi:hypothetical protein